MVATSIGSNVNGVCFLYPVACERMSSDLPSMRPLMNERGPDAAGPPANLRDCVCMHRSCAFSRARTVVYAITSMQP